VSKRSPHVFSFVAELSPALPRTGFFCGTSVASDLRELPEGEDHFAAGRASGGEKLAEWEIKARESAAKD
jgi:hypothetical protein